MPIYNGEKYIRRALDSLLAQDYENFELIISDNASSDGTWQVCQEYAAKDRCIRLNRNTRNIGVVGNFGVVLNMAHGPYFMWAAADDYWLPEFVRTMVNELDIHHEAGVAMCAVQRILEDGSNVDTVRFSGKDNPNFKSHYQVLMGLTSPKKHKYNLFIYGLFRTSLLQKGFLLFPDVPLGDRLFMCQIALATHFRYVDRILHIRTFYNQPTYVRRPSENSNKMWMEDRWVLFKSALALWRMLWRSSIIPGYRKIYIPAAILYYSLLHLRMGVRLRRRGWKAAAVK